MKALLICPADRNPVARLADQHPLAVLPLLGRSALEYWIEVLAARGVTQLFVVAADRPDQVRAAVGDGTRWGLQLEVVPEARELSVAEARKKYRGPDAAGWLADADVTVIDHLPGQPEQPLFETYAGWFAAQVNWMPHALTPARIGMREVEPGIFI